MGKLPELAVTGSTGQLGGQLARLLSAAGSPQRLLVRDARRAAGPLRRHSRITTCPAAVALNRSVPASRCASSGSSTRHPILAVSKSANNSQG